MDFKDQIKQLSDRADKIKEQIQTEEATKNALIMPFIQTLGYDVFNPLEVVPEFVADIGTKKGEKVDYAILKDGTPIMLIECKWWGENLDSHNEQLYRYYNVTLAKLGVLTNGIVYRFYTDLDEPNKMDLKPFLEFDITKMKDDTIEKLKQYHKSYLDLNQLVDTASELRYSTDIKNFMAGQVKAPSSDFVRFLVGELYPGRATEKIIKQFTDIAKKALTEYLSDVVSDKLQTVLDDMKTKKENEVEAASVVEEETKVVTTDEEKEGLFIIKSIVRQKFDVDRILSKDTQSYFGIFLDNLKKQFCRLYFNGSRKQVSYFENKSEVKQEISTLDDIYKFSEQIIQSAVSVDNSKGGN